MLPTKKWYAIYTRSHYEKRVANLLERKEIISYCPLNRIMRQWSDRKKIVLEPLFKSYVFVMVHEKEMLSVLETEGIINFVSWSNKPAAIRNEEIETIRDFLRRHTNVRLEKLEVQENDLVTIEQGPLSDYSGRVIEINNQKVKVHLPSLGYTLVVETIKSNLRILGKSTDTSIAQMEKL